MARKLTVTYLPDLPGPIWRVRVNDYSGIPDRPILDGDKRPIYEPVQETTAGKRGD